MLSYGKGKDGRVTVIPLMTLTMDDLIEIAEATLTGMDVEMFRDQIADRLASTRDPRCNGQRSTFQGIALAKVRPCKNSA